MRRAQRTCAVLIGVLLSLTAWTAADVVCRLARIEGCDAEYAKAKKVLPARTTSNLERLAPATSAICAGRLVSCDAVLDGLP
jgi:hypothetical protein